MPAAQPSNAVIQIAAIDFRPANSNQAQEYLCLTNPNSYAVDISGWRLDGGVRYTFKGGTILPANSVAYVSPDKRAFRARPLSPRGGEQRLVLGNYEGNLSAWGEGLSLADHRGRLVTTNYFPGNPSLAQRYLRITEIMYNPSPLTGNTNGAQEFEYIELKNIGPALLDLRGVRLTNGVEFSFAGGAITALVPGARMLVVKNTNTFAARYGNGLPVAGQYTGSLENKGEEIRLEDAFGEKILQFSYNNSWYPITEASASPSSSSMRTRRGSRGATRQAGVRAAPSAAHPARTIRCRRPSRQCWSMRRSRTPTCRRWTRLSCTIRRRTARTSAAGS